VFHRALNSSDPFLSSILSQNKYKSVPLPKEAIPLLEAPPVEAVIDNAHFEFEPNLDFQLNTDDK